ncbi:MAG: M16 family metallopeptidase [Xanthobacteraceae bacterium]
MNAPVLFRAGRRIAFGFATAVTLCVPLVPASAMTIERVTSPGGIEAWVVRDAAVPLIAVDFEFSGGTDQDPKDKAGLASLAASLLDEGAGSLDSKAFQEKLERRAIELSFRANRDAFRGTLRTLKENRDEAFEVLRLAINEPRFDAEAVERMRAQTLSQLRRNSTNPNDIASRTWWANAFPEHPYGQPPSGTPETVAAIGVDDLRGYTRRVLARDNLKIAIVGDIDLETAGRLLDSTFGALPAKAELTPVPNVTPQGMGRRVVVELDVPQAVIFFGGPGVARSDPDFMAAYVVNHILGGGSFSSRLYSEVREKRGLAYGISTSLVWLDHSAVLLGGTATRADATGETLRIIETEFKRLAAEGPTEEELAKTKTYLKGSFALGLDTSSKIAAQLVQMQTDNLGIDYIERRSAMIDAITLADAKRAAKRLLDAGLLVTVVGRPQGVTSN